jgi:protein-disulfide isomerase
MASRKQQKEQARAARLAQEQNAASNAQRTRRLQMFGGVTVIAVIVIVVAIVISSGGSNNQKGTTPGLASGAKLAQIKSSVNSVLGTIPESGTTLGNPNAPVTMQYFGDLECPICQAFTLDVFPTFVAQEVKTNHVKVVYRSMCTATCDGKRTANLQNEQFNSQQLAAYAAGKQNRFWQFAELFYHQQGSEGTGYADSAFLSGLAKQIPGLNLTKWQTDRSNAALKAQLAADGAYANKAALSGTPTLIMSGKKGSEEVTGTYQGVYAFPDASQLAAAVNQVS